MCANVHISAGEPPRETRHDEQVSSSFSALLYFNYRQQIPQNIEANSVLLFTNTSQTQIWIGTGVVLKKPQLLLTGIS